MTETSELTNSTDTVVKSLAGEEVLIYSDHDFAVLAGFDPDSKSFNLSMQMQPSRLAVLRALWRHGAIIDKSGFAVGHLAERVREFDQLSFNVSAVLNAPLLQVAVERVTAGRRTMKIGLVALPHRWLRAIEGVLSSEAQPRNAGDWRPKPDEIVEPETDSRLSPPPLADPHAAELEVASAVATALMAQVVDIIMSNGGGAISVKNTQLQQELGQVSKRLGEQTEYTQRLRRELREAQDMIGALTVERDGLRARAQEAERNLKIATGADAQRLIDAEVHKQVDRLMRQAPGSAKPTEDELRAERQLA